MKQRLLHDLMVSAHTDSRLNRLKSANGTWLRTLSMKRGLTALLALLFVISGYCADVTVKLSGLEPSGTAKLIISSNEFLATIDATDDGSYTFTNVPAGTHFVKVEADGYESSPSQCIVIKEDGSVAPSQAIQLVVTPMTDDEKEWVFQWKEDGSTSGYTKRSHVNEPAEIEFLGKKIVPADVPSSNILQNDYHIYLVDDEVAWSHEYAYRLLETLKTLPSDYNYRPYSSFRLTSSSIADDIQIQGTEADGYEVLISTQAFNYANPFLVNLDGVRGRLFSKRLHHALTNFATDFGKDQERVNRILKSRFGCSILGVDYTELTAGITDEGPEHFQEFFPSELVSIINMLEELPEGFHVTPHLNYLIRRINGMPHPLYPEAAAVSWCTDNGYIEFMESTFGSNNQGFETLRLILHEKTHFLWAYMFSDEIKEDWIKVGGWIKDPNTKDGWSTTKDTEFVSAYAHAHNPNEDMAESVAFYLRNPDKLMSRSPEKYEFICNRIMHGTRYISKIPDHLSFEVLNLFPDYDYPGKIKGLSVKASGDPEEDKKVTVEIELNDEEGFDDAATAAVVRLNSPSFLLSDGTEGYQYYDLWMHPVDGDGHLLRGSITMSKYSKSGHWTFGDIDIRDMQGNQRFEGRNDCVSDLYINNPLEDILPPVFDGNLRYTLTDIDLDGHPAQNLEVRFNISDNIGFKRIVPRLQLPGSTYHVDVDGYYDEATGEGVVNIPITEFYPNGDYFIDHVSLYDVAGNSIWFTFSDDPNDFPKQYIHIETTNPDTETPEVDLDRITVYAEPTHPEAPDGETRVTISYFARDNKSGYGKCSYRLRDPQGIDHFEYHCHRNFYTRYFDGDPTIWERYQINVILPKGSAPGIWGLSEMTVADKAFNERTYNFVETLIFEPDDSESDYELFADIKQDVVTFDVKSSAENAYGYTWRLIHETSGLELSGSSKDAVTRAVSASSQIDVSKMPGGDLILIVKVHDEGGAVQSVKTRRLAHERLASEISIEAPNTELTEGETLILKAVISPDDVTDTTVSWTSSDETVATVDENGLVTALQPGSTTITAQAINGLEATCVITVVARVIEAEGIELNMPAAEVIEGETVELTATITPAETTDKSVTWSSSDETIATVDQNGTVTALKAGNATITAKTANGKTATCAITVKAKVILADGISLDVTEKIIKEEELLQLTATVTPADATDQSVTWTSSDETVATVDQNGTVTALKAGTATITAETANGLKATCVITVEAKTGVDGVEADAQISVAVRDGVIVVTASEDAEVEVYSLTGMRVAKTREHHVEGLAKGVYIVTVGGKAFKVIVK